MSHCKSSFGIKELLSPCPCVDTSWFVFRGWWCEVSGKLLDSGWSYPTSGLVLNVLQSVTGLWCTRTGHGIPCLHLALRPCGTKTPLGKGGGGSGCEATGGADTGLFGCCSIALCITRIHCLASMMVLRMTA